MKSTNKNIDSKLNACLPYLTEREKELLLNMAEALAGKEAGRSEIGAEEMAELDRRWDDYKKGKVKTYSWDSVNQEIAKKLKTLKR